MISPWIWSQTWICSNDMQSLQNAGIESINAVNDRGYSPRNIFGLKHALEICALEEALVKRIQEQKTCDVPKETEIEILCRASTTDLELLVDGEIVFADSIDNPSE
jgi:hypothetical protein